MLTGVLRRLLQEMVLPELKQLRAEGAEIRTTLQLTNKRLDDSNAHLIDLSRRIDTLREELTQRIDETNRRIDALQDDLVHRIDATNDRLNRLYEVIVRREEHEGLAQRLTRLEQKVEDLAARHAA
jgi:DNA polymerase II large subunit